MTSALITLFLCGDLMTGRGVDQILPFSNAPLLFESYVRDARTYVSLAEKRNGPIPDPADYRYPWGDALKILDEIRPNAKIVNLETSITTSDDFWPKKGIHYRMHPANVELLKVAAIDVCVLANNHVLDLRGSGAPGKPRNPAPAPTSKQPELARARPKRPRRPSSKLCRESG